MAQRLLLHMGMPKTGSSALQVALVRNREQLSRAGIDYPSAPSDARARRGEVTSGNGAVVARLLDSLVEDDTNRLPALRDLAAEIALAPRATVVYSSEHLYRASPRLLRLWRDMLQTRGVTLCAVVYVRDVAEHALSHYSQSVKWRGFSGDFAHFVDEEYMATGRVNLRPRLPDLLDVLGDHLVVHHYDSERHALVESFLTTLGVRGLNGFETSPGLVNRSLTRHEIEVMRLVNAKLGDRSLTRRVSDAIISYEPVDEFATTISELERDRLQARFAEDVRWVNDAFFGDRRLRVVGDIGVTRTAKALDMVTPGERALLDVLVHMAGRAGEAPGARRGPLSVAWVRLRSATRRMGSGVKARSVRPSGARGDGQGARGR